MKTKPSMASSSFQLFAAAAISCAALGASAEIKILRADITGNVEGNKEVGSESNRYAWNDGGNWTPNGVPTQDDAIIWASENLGSNRKAYIDLDGDCSAGWLTNNFRNAYLYKSGSSESDVVSLTFYHQLGCGQHQWHTVNSGVKLVLASGAELQGALWDGSASTFTLTSGAEIDVLGQVQSRHITWTVPVGAVLRFTPSTYVNFTSSDVKNSAGDVFDLSGGDVYFSNGLAVTGGNQYYDNVIDHSAGTVTFGGNFTSEVTVWTYDWSGGTLRITDDCAFGNNISLVIPAQAAVSLDIASGKTFAAPGLSTDSTASITVTGGGTFSIAPTTASIILQNGSLGIATSGTYDLSNVSVGSGAATIALTAFGATINSLPVALAGATFFADLSNVVVGTVVLNSSDPSVLAKVKSDLDASVPAGMALVVSGTTLSLEKDAGSDNTISASGDLLAGASWGGGEVPAADAEVAIAGAGVVATYSGGEVPSWALIEVKDGATLRIASAASGLPQIKLNKNATLEIVDGASLTLSSSSDLVGVATSSQVPALSVASGATLNVPGGMKFSNVNIDLKGTMAVSPAGTITFGYAAAGETTYIGFNSVGGKITNGVVWGYDGCRIEICCPAQGGTVIAPESIVFKDMPVIGEYLPTNSDNYWNGFSLGVNNPESVSFNVVFDNTKWNASGNLYVKGGATFWLKNDSVYMNDETYSLYNRHAEVSGNGCIIIESGSELRIDAMGNSGDTPAVFNASVMGHESVIVADGGIYDNYRTTGNGNGVFAASNAVITVHVPIIDEDVTGSSGTKHYCNTNVVFEGFSSVSLATNSTMTITTRNSSSSYSRFTDNSGDRVVSLANVPITGAGSIALSNDNVNVFGVVVRSGSNTATGSASVIPPAAGKGETTLYFADGANWAGTVTANGHVALTNLTDATAAKTVSFGAVDMESDLVLNFYGTAGALTNDMVNITGAGYSGTGRLELQLPADVDATPGKVYPLGTFAGGATRPTLKGNYWKLVVENGQYGVKRNLGMTIFIR